MPVVTSLAWGVLDIPIGMTKRELILLLLPCALVLAVAIVSLRLATVLSAQTENIQQIIGDLTQAATRGDFGPKADRLVEVASVTWQRQDELQKSMAGMHAINGGILFVALALQAYFYFTVRKRVFLKSRSRG